MRRFIQSIGLAGAVIFLLTLFQSAYAQTGTVKGVVKDNSGNPLPGASIIVSGKKSGTVTDPNGQYQLKLSPGQYTFTVTFIGHTSQEATVIVEAGKTLQQDITTSEVFDLAIAVVVGSRSRNTRSKLSTPVPVDVIRTKDIKPYGQIDISQMLSYNV